MEFITILNLGVCILLRVWDPGKGGFIPSTQRYYRRFFTIYYYLSCYMFRSYDHLQEEIYLLGFTRLETNPLFLECG
jgi:hypothetical protein